MINQREKVIAEAMTWLRTPYHHHAEVKGAGVDCAKFLIEVYAAVGAVDKFDVGHYSPDWMLHRSEEVYQSWVEKYATQTDTPKMGDIALFKFGRCFSHAGIILDFPQIIHAYRNAGMVTLDDVSVNADLIKREVKFYTLWKDE